jgi:hypothetical protein
LCGCRRILPVLPSSRLPGKEQMMRTHMKMMWMCVAVAAVAFTVAAVSGFEIGFAALFALPCLFMMGAMAWMMVRMARHGSGHGH